MSARGTQLSPPSNRELLLPHLLPYLCYLGTLIACLSLGRAPAYALAACVAAGVLYRQRGALRPLRGPESPPGSIGIGVATGLFGAAVWIGLVIPFAGTPQPAYAPVEIVARMLAATLVVPLIEEHLMRSFALGFVVQLQRERAAGRAGALDRTLDQASILNLEPGAATPFAVSVSAAVFALGHAPGEWLAAWVYGVLMGVLYARRRDLLACVSAHAASNLGLALYVITTGDYSLW